MINYNKLWHMLVDKGMTQTDLQRTIKCSSNTISKKWSAVCDSVIHEKPKFIKRTRDKMWFSNLETIAHILNE